MSLGIPQSQEPVGQAQRTKPLTDLNEALEALRGAVYEGVKAVLAVLANVPDDIRAESGFQIAKDYITNLGLTPAGADLFCALAVREGFNWQAQLEAAQQNIARVNAANNGLTLVTEYDLAALINALAAQNNPDQLKSNLALMKEPTLIIAPEGLTLNHLRASLTYNGLAPYVDDLYNPDQRLAKVTVYIIDAGDTTDMQTQPPAIQGRSTLTRQQIRDIMNELGIKLDAHGYALLANLLMSRDPQVLLDSGIPISILNGHDFPNNPAYVANAQFSEVHFDFFIADSSYAFNSARARVSVMATL